MLAAHHLGSVYSKAMAAPPSTQWLRQRAITIFMLLVFGYLVLGSVKLVIENYRVNQDTKRLETELSQLEQHNLELQSLLAYYRTESYKEKEARARLNFQKPGERLVVVPQPTDEEPSITQPSTETQPPTPPSNPRQWWNYFFGPRA